MFIMLILYILNSVVNMILNRLLYLWYYMQSFLCKCLCYFPMCLWVSGVMEFLLFPYEFLSFPYVPYEFLEPLLYTFIVVLKYGLCVPRTCLEKFVRFFRFPTSCHYGAIFSLLYFNQNNISQRTECWRKYKNLAVFS